MFIGVNQYTLGDDSPLEELLDIVVEDGYDFIELNTMVRIGGRKRDMLKRDPKPVMKLLKDRGVRVGAIAAGNDFAQPLRKQLIEQVENVKRCVDLARAFKAPVVRIFGGEPKPDIKEARCLDMTKEGCKLVAEYAAEKRINLGLENHGFVTNDPQNLREIMDAIKNPALGLAVDTSNFYWFGLSQKEVYKAYQTVAPYTVYVHVKNGSQRQGWARNGKYTATNLMDGELNLDIVFEELAKYNYDGLFCIEYEGPGDKREEAKAGLEYLRTILG